MPVSIRAKPAAISTGLNRAQMVRQAERAERLNDDIATSLASTGLMDGSLEATVIASQADRRDVQADRRSCPEEDD